MDAANLAAIQAERRGLYELVRHPRFVSLEQTSAPFEAPQMFCVTVRDTQDKDCRCHEGTLDTAVAFAMERLQVIIREEAELLAAPPLFASAAPRKTDPRAVTQPMHGVHCGIHGGGRCNCDLLILCSRCPHPAHAGRLCGEVATRAYDADGELCGCRS